MAATLDIPPFPLLTWDRSIWDAWTTSISLPAWADVSDKRNKPDENVLDDEQISVIVQVPLFERVPPSPEQAAAFTFLVEQQNAIRDTILSAIFERYTEWKTEYLSAFDEENKTAFQELMPDLTCPEELKSLVDFIRIHFFCAAEEGIGYVGFEFDCTWDTEHGLGATTHKSSVVSLGDTNSLYLI